MHHVVRAASARVASAVLALGVVAALPPTPAAASPAGPPVAAPAEDRATGATGATDRDDPLLEDPAGGTAALRELGDRLPTAARRNDLAPRDLATLLRSDRTARLDTDGLLFYVEPAASDPPPVVPDGRLLRQAAAPLGDTFALHSNPGASRTILIDVDGHTTDAEDAWHVPGVYPAWDLGGNGPAFDDAERAAVQLVWSMVSEDFAAYDVDVTTQDPGRAGLERDSPEDPTYGVRALVTPSDPALSALCGDPCGGLAYVDVFSLLGGDYQTAWVFPQALGQSPKAVAEATSHEVGHTLGLDHDGTARDAYYGGHGAWAPIMGVGYGRPLTQWSRGEYAGASNREDDLALIGRHLPRRADEPPGPPPATAYVTSAADRDTFTLGQCSAGSVVTVRSPSASPDLDVVARLLSPDGSVLVTDDPVAGRTDDTRAYGLDAALGVPADGRYLVEVAGAGSGAVVDGVSAGWTTYASLGAYVVEAPGCDPDPAPDPDAATAPPAPTGVTATAGPGRARVSWTAPTADGGSPVTSYSVTSTPGGATAVLGGDARSATLSGLANGTPYRFVVTAVNAVGSSPASAASAPVTPAAAPVRMAAPGVSVRGTTATVTWRPAAANGAPVTGYTVLVSGERSRQVAATRRAVVVKGVSRGRHTVRVTATNRVGTSPASAATTIRVR